MKLLKTVLIVFLLLSFLTGCSSITDLVMQDANSHITKSNQSEEKTSTGSGNTKKQSGSDAVVVPPQMIGYMFSMLYQLYFSWGGIYSQDSLAGGQWAKYEFNQSDKPEDKIYITKACLRKSKIASTYVLKIENGKDWMKLEFDLNASLQLNTLRYSNSQGVTQEVGNVSFMVSPKDFNYQFAFPKLPRKNITTFKGKMYVYEYKLSVNGGNFVMYLNPKIPGFLVMWEAQDEESKTQMRLIAYGYKAGKELK